MKQQHIVVITVDVEDEDINREDENSILKKCTEAIIDKTNYQAWEVECYKIEDEESVPTEKIFILWDNKDGSPKLDDSGLIG